VGIWMIFMIGGQKPLLKLIFIRWLKLPAKDKNVRIRIYRIKGLYCMKLPEKQKEANLAAAPFALFDFFDLLWTSNSIHIKS
jgi:hypothetical protein